jgi:adenine-specific DNA-methyltransferase
VKYTPPQGTFHRFSRESLSIMERNGQIYFGAGVPQKKTYLSEVSEYVKLTTFWDYKLAGSTRQSNKEIKELIGSGIFSNPKPVKLLHLLIDAIAGDSDIILDFFSGSATTAHAVMQLNAEDGGNRNFIMVQLPEPTDEKSDAYKAGFMNICEIGKERIRRAGEKIKEEKGLEAMNLDVGFKVLKLDTSNIRKWQPDFNDIEQSLLDYVDNYVEGRTELDVVYEIMLKYGLDLTYPVDEFTIAQKKVYSIGFGMLMICLDDEITTEVAKGILGKIKELSPESSRVVFKDNGFKSDSNKTNIKEILKSGGIEEFITI